MLQLCITLLANFFFRFFEPDVVGFCCVDWFHCALFRKILLRIEVGSAGIDRLDSARLLLILLSTIVIVILNILVVDAGIVVVPSILSKLRVKISFTLSHAILLIENH